MQSADAAPGPWPPPQPGGAPGPPPPTAQAPPPPPSGGERWIARACAAVVVVAVVISLIVLAARAVNDDAGPDVVPVRGTPPARPTTTVTTVPPTTVPPTTVARTTVPRTTVPRTTVPRTTTTSVAPTTTTTTTTSTTAPATTATTSTVAPPAAELAAVLGGQDQSAVVQGALENARGIAAALAAGDWAEARRLGPTDRTRTDAQLEAGYGAVTDVTLIPARVIDRGARTDLRLGVVAHEAHDTGPATAVMCVHWSVNNSSGSVQRISSKRLRLEPGLVAPASVADELSTTCATYPLR